MPDYDLLARTLVDQQERDLPQQLLAGDLTGSVRRDLAPYSW
jgi:hypothetical protein